MSFNARFNVLVISCIATALQTEVVCADLFLEEVLVTSRHRPELQSDYPGSINALTSREIGVSSSGIDFIANRVSNVHFDTTSPVSGSSNSASLYIRGVGQSEFLITNDPGVGVFLDGVYLSRTLGSVLDTANIDRIEIVKGPQGALYGKNTIGGALNVITRKPATKVGAVVNARYGEDNRRDISLVTDLPLVEDKLFSQFSYGERHIDGYAQRVLVGQKQGDENRQFYTAKLRWDVSESIDWQIAHDRQKIDEKAVVSALAAGNSAQLNADIAGSTFGSLYNSLVGGFDARYFTGSLARSNATGPNFSKLDAYGVSSHLTYQNDDLELTSITAYRSMDASFGRDPDGTPIVVLHTQNSIDHSQASQEFRLYSALSEQFTLLTGAFYFEEKASDYLIADIFPELFSLASLPLSISGPYKTRSESWAGYVQLDWYVPLDISITLAGRFTSEKNIFSLSKN